MPRRWPLRGRLTDAGKLAGFGRERQLTLRVGPGPTRRMKRPVGTCYRFLIQALLYGSKEYGYEVAIPRSPPAVQACLVPGSDTPGEPGPAAPTRNGSAGGSPPVGREIRPRSGSGAAPARATGVEGRWPGEPTQGK